MARDDQIPKRIAKVAALAAACARPGDDLIRVHLIKERKAPYASGSIRRAGGRPIGVDEHTRPRYDGQFMQHLLTIDLDEVPQVRVHAPLANARALAVFIADADDNCAWDADTDETAVLALTEDDLVRGEWNGPDVADPPARSFDLYPVDVPVRAFATDIDEETAERKLWKLHLELMSSGRVGGPVVHWSGDTNTDGFVMQFHEEVVDVNLGDAGTMYVFTNAAYSTSH
jgi:hypothetical protein